MPGRIVRVYPASGAVAMLPLTPGNNWTPTILFCGGTLMTDDQWGNYSFPNAATWNIPASNDCQRITPEPTDGSAVHYVQDDNMIQGRTMGQFIALPDGTYLVVNGGANGTAGYADQTGTTPHNQMPFTMSLATGPTLQPAIYNPNGPSGSRWSNTGLGSSKIPRLYHSSAILLPDASVLIAGSNPNVDYNPNAYYPTTFDAEIFYPQYFNKTKPTISGVPQQLGYGGDPFDISFGTSSYTGNANNVAGNSTVVLIRPGFTTHAMNMGQRLLQLNNTYTVYNNGTIVLHVAQLPPNPNLITPGPVLFFVNVNGIPSNGTLITVGTGNFGVQPTKSASVLPANIKAQNPPTSSSGNNSGSPQNDSHKVSSGLIVAAGAGGAIVLIVLGAVLLVFCKRRRDPSVSRGDPYNTLGGSGLPLPASTSKSSDPRNSDAFIPLQQYNNSAWNVGEDKASIADSRVDLQEPQLYAAGSEKYPDYGTNGGYTSPASPTRHSLREPSRDFYSSLGAQTSPMTPTQSPLRISGSNQYPEYIGNRDEYMTPTSPSQAHLGGEIYDDYYDEPPESQLNSRRVRETS